MDFYIRISKMKKDSSKLDKKRWNFRIKIGKVVLACKNASERE